MKVLLLDAGNTRLKWAFIDTAAAGKLRMTGSCSYADSEFLKQLQSTWGAAPRVDRVLLSCVAGDTIISALNDTVRHCWGVSPDVLGSEAAFAGIINGYSNPHQLGVDRWLAMIGGRRSLAGPAPMWIVDCGTAVTIDYVERDGHHRGGLILPGLMTMHERLTATTAALKAFNSETLNLPETLDELATDTATALARGIAISLVASLNRVTSTDVAGTRIITGGDGAVIAPYLDGHWLLRPNLVLEGMAVYAEECG